MPVGFDKKNAVKGAAIGSFVGPLGTVVGAGLGAFASDELSEMDPTKGPRPSTFTPPELDKGQQFQSTYKPTAEYKPTAYAGQFDAAGGGKQLTALEETLGVQGFNGDQFRNSQSAAIDSQVARNTQAAQRVNDQAAMNSGLGNSGMNRALDQLARSEGDAASIQAKAALEGQIAGLQQSENQFRTNTAMGAAGQTLQNTQFGANLGENQAQFGANFQEGQNQFGANMDLQTANLNEGQRQFNETAKYGTASDQHMINEVLPIQLRDQRRGALLGAGTSLGGGLLQGAGAMAAACWIAEALYGPQDFRTHNARYAVNVIWPEYKVGRFFRGLYLKYGQQVAKKVEQSKILEAIFTPVFGLIWRQGAKAMKEAK
jgi:hypothetical protein